MMYLVAIAMDSLRESWKSTRNTSTPSNQHLMNSHKELLLGRALIVVQLCSTKKAVSTVRFVDTVSVNKEK